MFLLTLLTRLIVASIFLASSSSSSSAQGAQQLSEVCKKLYAKVETAPTDSRTVPLFISNPGSGNTWLRLVMEFLTSRTTGSFHNDDSLYKDFSGESRCDNRQCFIKAHPIAIDASHMPYSEMVSIDAAVRQKCRKGGIASFDRFLFVMREPVASFWSTFHLVISASHTGIFKAFPEERMQKFSDKALRWSEELQEQWDTLIYPRIVQFPEKAMVLKYENFVNPALRYQEFRTLCTFVDCGDPSIFASKLECALQFAERDNIHRRPDVNVSSTGSTAANGVSISERTAVAVVDYKKMVFEKSPNLACEMYQIMQNVYNNFSYAPYGNAVCSK